MHVIRALQAHEWPLYRSLRLRALQDAPDAFGSTYGAEAVGTDEHWAARLKAVEQSSSNGAFTAETEIGPCGLVWCKVSAADPTLANLYQMWVAPEARGQGLGRGLLAAALRWAQAAGVHRVQLGVTADDSPAWRLYTSHGFRAVGALAPLREGSAKQAQTMERTLR